MPTRIGSSRAFVAVEGTAGVGKTSSARDLRSMLGARLFHFGLERLRSSPSVGLFEDLQPLARLVYFLASSIELSDRVRTALVTDPVVCDRYVASPLAVLDAEGVLGPRELTSVTWPIRSRLIHPSWTLFLTASHAIAVQRLRSRVNRRGIMQRVHQTAMASQEFYVAWETNLRKRVASLGPFAELDTSALSRGELRAAVRSQLRAAGPLLGLDS